MQLTSQTGQASLENVQKQVDVRVGTGSIKMQLTGTAWNGAGMGASTHSGGISLKRPAQFQAAITAKSDLGTASIDDLTATTSTPALPAIIAAGSGAPIMLEAVVGNVVVSK